MEENDSNFYFKKDKAGAFFNNSRGVWIYELAGGREKKGNWAYIAAGVFFAVLNYYVFAILYLSFRAYNVISLSFLFGLAAILGSLFVFWLFLRNFLFIKTFFISDSRGEKVVSGLKKDFFSVLNSNYLLTDAKGGYAGRVNKRGLLRFALFVYDSNGEALFRMDRKKGVYYFYGVTGHAVGFAKKSSAGAYSIDLSRDVNGQISQKFCAAAMFLV